MPYMVLALFYLLWTGVSASMSHYYLKSVWTELARWGHRPQFHLTDMLFVAISLSPTLAGFAMLYQHHMSHGGVDTPALVFGIWTLALVGMMQIQGSLMGIVDTQKQPDPTIVGVISSGIIVFTYGWVGVAAAVCSLLCSLLIFAMIGLPIFGLFRGALGL